MPPKLSIFRSILSVIKKDALCELRSRSAISTLLGFALTTLACLGMSVGVAALDARLTAALLWVILFFSAMAGLSRVFAQEQDAGTITTLKVYAPSQAVFIGKLSFNILLLLGLSVVTLPLFIVFFNISAGCLPALLGVAALGITGMAATSTITAAMAAQTQGRFTLFTIITFPLILPGFLCAISLTTVIMNGQSPPLGYILFLCGFDITAIAAGSMLFDFLWES